MKSMLQELVSKGSAAFASSAARSASLCTSATQRLDQGISALSTAQRHIQHETEQHDQSVSALLTSTTHQFTSDMSIVAEQRATADSTLSTVSGMVGTKRKYLDETVTELCAHVDEAIAQGVTVVENTSVTANKVLSDVSQASQAMNSTASSAMDTFTAFMDQEGEALCSGLQSHFDTVAAHAQVQTQDLSALQKAAGIHNETMEGQRLASTGRTPQKVAPVSFEGPFKRTRSHGIIRTEAKNQLLAEAQQDGEQELSYETARAGIIDCIALSASLPMDTVFTEESAAVAPLSIAVEENEEIVHDRSSTGSASVASRASNASSVSRDSTSSKNSSISASTEQVDIDGEGGFLLGPSENVNPNITTTRQSRGNASKSRSKLAAPGSTSSRSTRNVLAQAMDTDM